MDKPALQWSHPVANPEVARRLLLVISPFATHAAVERLFEATAIPAGLQIVTTWSASALLSGSSDPELYPLLKQAGGRLYLHPEIHLKLYILNTSEAILSTGNLTLAGLGLSQHPNIELSHPVALRRNDWAEIDRILQQSRPVTDEDYIAANAFIRENQPTSPPQFQLPSHQPNSCEANFSFLSLPATRYPEDLWQLYSSAHDRADPVRVAMSAHDLNLYNIARGLDRDAFFINLGLSFRAHPFIQAIVSWIRAEQSVSFGQVKAWIHSNCSDRPVPYRRDLTAVTQALFVWLPHFYQEANWSIPGAHAEVLSWDQTD